MNKFYASILVVLMGVIGLIFFVTQSANFVPTKSTAIPTLPPDNTFPSQQIQQPQRSPQEDVPTTPIPITEYTAPISASESAIIKTNKGDIAIVLFGDIARNTVRNFLSRATSNYFDNLTFHRIEDWVAQGGDPAGNGTGGGSIPVEFSDRPFVVGSIGAASRGDGKVQNDSQFFITKTDASWLNGKYTNFGQVISGMDVVNQLQIGDKILSIIK